MVPTSADDRERLLQAHLDRAGELLRGEDLAAAEVEIAAAISLQADDVRARNMLGLVHFRAGRFPEALDLFLQLVAADPEDTALRLNLGLVELRLGKNRDAERDLRHVVQREPRNNKARGYLGLAVLRGGDLVGARRLFLEAGHEELARQVEDRIANAEDEAERSVGEVRRIAEAGLRAVEEKELPFASVDAELREVAASRAAAGTVSSERASSSASTARVRVKPVAIGLEGPRLPDADEAAAAAASAAAETAASWQVRVPGSALPTPGREGPPLSLPRVEPLDLVPPTSIAEFATRRLIPSGVPGEPFALTTGGLLVIRLDGRLATRTSGALLSAGSLTYEPLTRRARGVTTTDPFGDDADAVMVASGKGLILVAPRGLRFTALALANDILYVREPALYAFEVDTLHWENGRIPGGGTAGLTVAQFRGTGRVVIRSERPLLCVKVTPDITSYVDHSSVVGWIGRVVPRQMPGAADGEVAPYLECTGEGALILEEPPSALPPPAPLQ